MGEKNSDSYEYSSDEDSAATGDGEAGADAKLKENAVDLEEADAWLGSSSSEDEHVLVRRQAKLKLDQDEFFP
jgi:hypothetical protein